MSFFEVPEVVVTAQVRRALVPVELRRERRTFLRKRNGHRVPPGSPQLTIRQLGSLLKAEKAVQHD